MTVTATPIYPQSLLSKPVQFTSSTSTTVPTQLLAAQTNGCKLEAIMVSSTDTSPRNLNLYINVSSTNYLLGTVSIPATAGDTNAIPAVNLLASANLPLPKDPNGNPYLYLDSNTSLTATPATSITSTDVWNIVCMGGAY